MNVPALKGIHYAMKSGHARRRDGGRGGRARARRRGRPARSTAYDAACARATSGATSHASATCGPRSSTGFYRGALVAGISITTLGKLPPGTKKLERGRRRPRARSATGRRPTRPPDGKLVFDKLSSVYLSGNKTRDDAPSHIRVDTKVRREVAEAWVHMCPAQVYEVAGEASPAGNVVDVEVTASNCVQCGAITAKGGRLTPPEGGDGPEYTQM